MENLGHIVQGVTCKNRFLKKCSKCKKDYDTSHHPNNYDCPDYKEMKLITYNVYEKENTWKNEAKKQ